jgi:hypothetical protein
MKAAALAVLFASITNAHAHVHLCFDGKEPPAAVHMDHDGGHAHHGDEQGSHDDVDVDLRDDGVAKSFKPDVPVGAPAVFFVLPAVVDVHAPPIAEHRTPGGPDPPHIRPPLRAPPLTLA